MAGSRRYDRRPGPDRDASTSRKGILGVHRYRDSKRDGVNEVSVAPTQLRECIIGMRDPYKEVDGKGIEKLQAAGIEVVVGVLEEESKELNLRKDPMIIISASGMAETGRILHHLKNNFLIKQ